MPYADYLMPTNVPGLSLTPGRRNVIHNATGLCILKLPAGLGRSEATGLFFSDEDQRTVRFLNLRGFVGALNPLAKLDWQGELSQAHQVLVDRVQPHYQDLASARAFLERQKRIEDTLKGPLSQFFNSERGKLMDAAYRQSAEARTMREHAQTPSQKAAATRAERQVALLCQKAGITLKMLSQLNWAAQHGTVKATLTGFGRIREQHQALLEARNRHTDQCRRVARAFLSCPDQQPLFHDLTLCLHLTGGGRSVRSSVYSHPFRRQGEPSDLARANRERVRRLRERLSFDPGHPDVRSATREYRIQAGLALLGRWTGQTSSGQKILDTRANAFYAATQFKTKKVRQARLAEELRTLENDFPNETYRTALLRGIRRKLTEMQAARYGLPVDLSELPEAPRWLPPRSPVRPLYVPPQGNQPSLF